MKYLFKEWNEACLSTGIPAISTDTAARIFAVLYVHGNNEAFCLEPKFLADVDYIRKRFKILEAVTPTEDTFEFRGMLKSYIEELEDVARGTGGITILCDCEFNPLYRKHGQLKLKK